MTEIESCHCALYRPPQPMASATVWPRLHIFVTLHCMCLYAIFVTLAIIFVALQCPVHVHVRYFCRAKQHVVATCPLLALLLSMTSSLEQVLLCFGAKVPLDIFLL